MILVIFENLFHMVV